MPAASRERGTQRPLQFNWDDSFDQRRAQQAASYVDVGTSLAMEPRVGVAMSLGGTLASGRRCRRRLLVVAVVAGLEDFLTYISSFSGDSRRGFARGISWAGRLPALPRWCASRDRGLAWGSN